MAIRQSNMEFLRIVAMFLIVCFHCAYKSTISFDALTPNVFAVKAMWHLGELGVNLFMLVTGYFMVRSSFRGEKLIRLICQVLFYRALTIGIACALGVYAMPRAKRDFALLLFPTITGSYWYVTAYAIIYVLSPWINRFIAGVSQKRLLGLILVMLLLYSVIPTAFGFLGAAVEGMLFYTRLTWLFIIYVIGAYLRLYPLRSFQSMWPPLALSLICLVVMLVAIGLIGSYPTLFAKLGVSEWAYFWPPNTVPMALLSIGIFGAFLNIDMGCSRVVNRVASTTLGVYLFHDGALQAYIWRGGVFNSAALMGSPWLIPYMLFASVCVFIAGMLVDLARQALEAVTLRPLLRSEMWMRFKSWVKGKASAAADRCIERESTSSGKG